MDAYPFTVVSLFMTRFNSFNIDKGKPLSIHRYCQFYFMRILRSLIKRANSNDIIDSRIKVKTLEALNSPKYVEIILRISGCWGFFGNVQE